MHLEDFHCLVKNSLPVSFKNPLSDCIANLVPDNFVISAANKKLVLQEKQKGAAVRHCQANHTTFAWFISDQKRAEFVCCFELMLGDSFY